MRLYDYSCPFAWHTASSLPNNYKYLNTYKSGHNIIMRTLGSWLSNQVSFLSSETSPKIRAEPRTIHEFSFVFQPALCVSSVRITSMNASMSVVVKVSTAHIPFEVCRLDHHHHGYLVWDANPSRTSKAPSTHWSLLVEAVEGVFGFRSLP